MATSANINLRRAQAQTRIDAVKTALNAPQGERLARDPELARVQELESLADLLESVQGDISELRADAKAKAAKPKP